MKPPIYECIDHTADMGIRIFGKNLPEVFSNAALALSELLIDCPYDSKTETRTISIKNTDWETLLISWLRELLYIWATRKGYVIRVQRIELSEYQLTAQIDFGYYEPGTCELQHDIKAITYHQIEVTPVENGYRAQVIFDV
jgi:SHS2 domain-containing protein